MSSLKRNSNEKQKMKYGTISKPNLCKYCQYSHVTETMMCPRCHFWQNKAPSHLVYRQKVIPSLSRVFILTLDDKKSQKTSRWNMFQQRTLPYLTRYRCIKFLGVHGKDENNVVHAIINLFPKEKKIQKTILDKQRLYPGSTGCYLSHLSIWKTAYDTKQPNEEYVLILEDDAKFEPYGIRNMEILLKDELKDGDFDILYLGHSPKLQGTKISPLLMRPPSKQIPQYRTNCGFWGYIIRLSSVPNLIHSVKSFTDQSIDETIQRHFGELVDALFLIKPIVTQSSLYSVRSMIDQNKL